MPGLKYDGFPYRYFGYPKSAKNVLEERPDAQARRDDANRTESGAVCEDASDRVIGPSRLFTLINKESSEMHGHTLETLTSTKRCPDFLFLAYTTSQFKKGDLDTLHAIGERAARDAGLSAFWCGSRCLDLKNPMEVSNFIALYSEVQLT